MTNPAKRSSTRPRLAPHRSSPLVGVLLLASACATPIGVTRVDTQQMKEVFTMEFAKNQGFPIGGGLWVPVVRPDLRIYNMAAASYGLQAGVQGFAYAMFFMTDSALDYLENSAGFEIGVGPSIVVVDAGKAKTLTTTTGRDDVYAFVFGQKGLMAGVGLQGSKITKVSP